MLLNIFSFSFISSLTFCYFYKNIWNYYNNKTPTGYGALLVFFFILYLYFFNFNEVDFVVYLLIAFIGLIYWIDDIYYLSSFFRFVIQFLCGALIAIFLLINFEYEINNYFVLFVIASGLLNIFLSNVINFYDGLDLNITTFLIILSFTIFALLENQILTNYALIILGFVLGFAIFNFVPNNIFFGDSGCFIISSFVSFIIIKSILISEFSIIYLLIPLALPSIDVAYVILFRVYKKESLLSRNYHHIYHKIENKYGNKLYLAPQIISALGLYLLTFLIPLGNLKMIILYATSSLILSLLIYFLIRKYVQ